MSKQEPAKILRPGNAWGYPLFVAIHWDLKRLSITGVHGPLANGDAYGGCGQCIDTLRAVDEYAPGWDALSVKRLADIWEAWHLNDMRPGCEHQRGEWDPSEEISLYHYKLNGDVCVERRGVKKESMESLEANGNVEITPEQKRLLSLPYTIVTDGDGENGPDATEYSLDRIEKKTTGWVYPKDHPKGLLCKACPQCGYKYGTSWLHEEVPVDVIQDLMGFPDSDQKPAWI